MSSTRERLHERLARFSRTEIDPLTETTLRDRIQQSGTGTSDAALRHFIMRAESAGSVVRRCSEIGELPAVLAPFLVTAERIILADHPLLVELRLEEGLRRLDLRPGVFCVTDEELQPEHPGWKREYASAAMGIDVAITGIAESGAVLIASSERESRAVSLLPEVHVTLLSERAILSSLTEAADLLRTLSEKGKASALTFVGGPSKTADIEKVLITGVHGPRIFLIVLLPDAAFDSVPS
ncbi:MAG: LUD domain-containing protein [Bacteroidetes bacterium]|nr:LUD domain-containing protein [Bacteroidota bacterium]